MCSDVALSHRIAAELGCELDQRVDSIYLGGGTPSVLASEQLEQLFCAVRDHFDVDAGAEITVECAPGTLSDEILQTLVRCGVNRVSLGVQSFVDQEAASVGRLHTRAITLADIARLRAAGIGNLSLDLIAGLPHQTEQSWTVSLEETLATGVPHVSVYMLEVDDESRLGTELLAGGSRYHAHFVPNEDLTADLYLGACERLEKNGVLQYEISNFARPVTHGIGLRDSRHNRKYWTREPYFGFGVDAHSMLLAGPELASQGIQAVRFATPDSLEGFSGKQSTGAGVQLFAELPLLQPSLADDSGRIQQLRSSRVLIDRKAAIEESFFLGLRMNRGVSLARVREQLGEAAVRDYEPVIAELVDGGLLERHGSSICLTSRGRLLSNEVFERFLRESSLAV